MQEFTGEKSVLAGRDVIIGEQSESVDDFKRMLVRRNIYSVMRIQFLQVTLLMFVLIMLIVNNVRDNAAEADRHHLRAKLDMYIMVTLQKKQ